MPADSNRLSIAVVKEVAFATHPGTQMTEVPFSSESFKHDVETAISANIRSDRRVADVLRLSIAASGALGFDMSYGAHDILLPGALLSADWAAPVTLTASTISASSVDNSINDSANGFTTGAGFAAGRIIRIAGFTGSPTTNNGFAKIVTRADGKLVLSGITLVTDAAGESVTVVQGAWIKDGTTFSSYWVEKKFGDLASEFEENKGMAIDTYALRVVAKQIITAEFGFLGHSQASATTTSGTGTNIAAGTNPVMTATDNVAEILEGGSVYSTNEFTLALKNNLRARANVGVLGAPSIGVGEIELTGTLKAYFISKVILDKFINFTTPTSFLVKLRETTANTNAYVIDVPSVKLTMGSRNAPSKNTDIMADINWTAKYDPTSDMTFQIARFP